MGHTLGGESGCVPDSIYSLECVGVPGLVV